MGHRSARLLRRAPTRCPAPRPSSTHRPPSRAHVDPMDPILYRSWPFRSDSHPTFRRSDAARCSHGVVVHPGAVDSIRYWPRAKTAARSDVRSEPIRFPDSMKTEIAFQAPGPRCPTPRPCRPGYAAPPPSSGCPPNGTGGFAEMPATAVKSHHKDEQFSTGARASLPLRPK